MRAGLETRSRRPTLSGTRHLSSNYGPSRVRRKDRSRFSICGTSGSPWVHPHRRIYANHSKTHESVNEGQIAESAKCSRWRAKTMVAVMAPMMVVRDATGRPELRSSSPPRHPVINSRWPSKPGLKAAWLPSSFPRNKVPQATHQFRLPSAGVRLRLPTTPAGRIYASASVPALYLAARHSNPTTSPIFMPESPESVNERCGHNDHTLGQPEIRPTPIPSTGLGFSRGV